MKRQSTVRATAVTDPGVVPRSNEDALSRRAPESPLEAIQKGWIWVIADGLGWHEQSGRASRLAAQTVAEVYWQSAIPDSAARLRAAILDANAALLTGRERQAAGPGTFAATVLAAAVVGNQVYIAHVGRSRAYLFRNAALRQLTDDHTFVADEIRAGRLMSTDVATHPRRNVITRVLGFDETLEVDLIEETLEPDDVLLLCSDGLYRDVDDDQIAQRLARYGPDAAPVLVEAAKGRGGHDNITAVTIAVVPVGETAESANERIALLSQVGRELATGLHLEDTLSSVLQRFLGLTGAERAALLLLREQRTIVSRITPSDISGETLLSYSRSVIDETLRRRQPLIIPDALDDPRFQSADSIVAGAVRSVLSIPLIDQEEAIGTLYADSRVADAFDQGDLDLLVAFASHAATAIQNARLHESLLQRTRELEAIRSRQDLLFRSLASAVIAIDHRGIITDWNPAAEEIFGLGASSTIGSALSQALPSPIGSWLMGLAVQSTQYQSISMGNEWVGVLGSRPRVVLAARVARLKGSDSSELGFVFVVNDRTELMLVQEAQRLERAERERLRELFTRYFAPSVAEQILQAPGAIKLGGIRQDLTLLFADIKGFTGLAERSQPEDVVALLNRYFALATTAVFEQLGTVDKFLGDGVMAIFGAPLPFADHPLAAIRAALTMRSQLEDLRDETGAQVSFGIGINSGPAIVGNIGADRFLSYTAVGDAVNVAARLQGAANSGEILISETTLRRVTGSVEVEEIGALQVKGRSAPVNTYRVIRLIDRAASP